MPPGGAEAEAEPEAEAETSGPSKAGMSLSPRPPPPRFTRPNPLMVYSEIAAGSVVARRPLTCVISLPLVGCSVVEQLSLS